jgi:hypothetical protein
MNSGKVSPSRKITELSFKNSLCAAGRMPFSDKSFKMLLADSLGVEHARSGGGFYCRQRSEHWMSQASVHTPPEEMVAVLRHTDLAIFTCPSLLPMLLRVLNATDQKAFFLAAVWHSNPSQIIELAAVASGYQCARSKTVATAWAVKNHLFIPALVCDGDRRK